MSVYKFILIDEFGGAMRKFVTRREALPYMTTGTKLVALPKEPSGYEVACLILADALL